MHENVLLWYCISGLQLVQIIEVALYMHIEDIANLLLHWKLIPSNISVANTKVHLHIAGLGELFDLRRFSAIYTCMYTITLVIISTPHY